MQNEVQTILLFSTDCCGSQIGFKETIPSSPFHRQTVGPAFYVRQGMSARTDISPPSRVIDFRMTGTIDDSLYIRLEWSAPGDAYDRGRGKQTHTHIHIHTHTHTYYEKITFSL